MASQFKRKNRTGYNENPQQHNNYVPAHISTSDDHSVNSEVTGAELLTPRSTNTKKKKSKKSKMKKLFKSPKYKSKDSKSVSGDSPPSVNSRATATAEAVGVGRHAQQQQPHQNPIRPPITRGVAKRSNINPDTYYTQPKDGGAKRPVAHTRKPASSKEAKTLHQRGIVYERIGDYNKAAKYYKQSADMHSALGDAESAAEVQQALDGLHGKYTCNLEDVDDGASVYSTDSRAKRRAKRIHEEEKRRADAAAAAAKKEEEKKAAGGLAGFTGAMWGGISSAAGAVGGTVSSAATATSSALGGAASSVGTTVTAASTAATSAVVGSSSPKRKKETHNEGTSKVSPPERTTPSKAVSVGIIKTTGGPDGGAVYAASGLVGPRKDNEFSPGAVEDSVTSFELYCTGFMHLRKREYEEARDDFDKAIHKTREPRPGIPNTELARTREYHADACYKLGEYENAEQSYKKAVELYQRESDEQEQSLARIMMKRGDNQIVMNQKSRANLYFNVSMRLWKKLLEKERTNEERMDDARLCHFMCNTANLMIKQENYKSAESLYEEIISTEAKDTTDNFEIIELSARANNAMGNIRYKERNFAEAIHYYEKALELRKKNHDVNKKEDIDDKEETIGLYTNLGRAYFQKKQSDQATKCFQKANRILMAEKNKDEMFIAENWIQMGKVKFKAGEYEEARELYNDALQMSSRIYEEDDDHILVIHHDIALTYCRECCYEAGIKIMEDVLVKKKKWGEEDLYLAKIHLDMGIMYLKVRSIRKGRTHLKHAAEVMDELDIPDKHHYMKELKKYQIKLMKFDESMTPSERRATVDSIRT